MRISPTGMHNLGLEDASAFLSDLFLESIDLATVLANDHGNYSRSSKTAVV